MRCSLVIILIFALAGFSGCRSSGPGNARGLPIPPALEDRNRTGLAIELVNDASLRQRGWEIIAMAPDSIRMATTLRSEPIVVDVVPVGERIVVTLLPRGTSAGSSASEEEGDGNEESASVSWRRQRMDGGLTGVQRQAAVKSLEKTMERVMEKMAARKPRSVR